MDLGIAGRKAIVCASSRGLGRACALALARANCEVVINGRDGKALETAAHDLRKATNAKIRAVQGDVATAEGQAALLAACPAPDILVNNNAGPPFRDFRELTRPQMIEGVIANTIVAIELVQKVIDSMVANKFGRIVNITSGSVKMPLAGLDLSSGARAGLTAFLAGVARSVAASNVTINFLLPGTFETERLQSNLAANAKSKGIPIDQARSERIATVPARRFGSPDERPRPDISPARISSSTAACFPARFKSERRLWVQAGPETNKAGLRRPCRTPREFSSPPGEAPGKVACHRVATYPRVACSSAHG